MPTPTIPMPDVHTSDGLLRPEVEVMFTHAAELCGCSVDTVRRAHRAGRLPGARKDDDAYGRWWVPVGDLPNAGLLDAQRVQRTTTTNSAAPQRVRAEAIETERLHDHIESLTRALAASQEHAATLARALERTIALAGA